MSSGLPSGSVRWMTAVSGIRVPDRYLISVRGQPSCSGLRPEAAGQIRLASFSDAVAVGVLLDDDHDRRTRRSAAATYSQNMP